MTGYIPILLFRVTDSSGGLQQLEVTPSEAAWWAEQARPARRLDNRVYCRYARAEDAAAAGRCPELDPAGFCRLNGVERRDPCVFDLPESAEVWERIRASVEEYREKGWPE